jgi:hypothetical protein
MVCRIPGELAEKSCQVLGELVGGSTNVTDNEPQWDTLFKYLGKSIQSQRSRAGRMQLFGNIFC